MTNISCLLNIFPNSIKDIIIANTIHFLKNSMTKNGRLYLIIKSFYE